MRTDYALRTRIFALAWQGTNRFTAGLTAGFSAFWLGALDRDALQDLDRWSIVTFGNLLRRAAGRELLDEGDDLYPN